MPHQRPTSVHPGDDRKLKLVLYHEGKALDAWSPSDEGDLAIMYEFANIQGLPTEFRDLILGAIPGASTLKEQLQTLHPREGVALLKKVLRLSWWEASQLYKVPRKFLRDES